MAGFPLFFPQWRSGARRIYSPATPELFEPFAVRLGLVAADQGKRRRGRLFTPSPATAWEHLFAWRGAQDAQRSRGVGGLRKDQDPVPAAVGQLWPVYGWLHNFLCFFSRE